MKQSNGPAPYSYLSQKLNSDSTRSFKSFIQEDGDQSKALSLGDKGTERVNDKIRGQLVLGQNAPRDTREDFSKRNESNVGATRIHTTESSVSTMPETEKDSSSKSLPQETSGIRTGKSVEVLPSLDQEISESMNCLDDSIRDLRSLYRDQAQMIKDKRTTRNHLDTKDIQGILNTAKTAAQYMKMKIDLIKITKGK